MTPASDDYIPISAAMDGWYFGIPVPINKFATVAGMCTKWAETEKPLVDQARLRNKKSKEEWAKKNCCTIKKRTCTPCGGGGFSSKKTCTGCSA